MGTCSSSSKKHERRHHANAYNPYMGKTRDIAVGERCWQCQNVLTKTKVAFEGKGFCDRCYEQVTGDLSERGRGYRPHRPAGGGRREKHRPHAMEHHHHYQRYNQDVSPGTPGVMAYHQPHHHAGGYRQQHVANDGFYPYHEQQPEERMDGYYDYSNSTYNDSGYDQ
eukprot:TRINITY_DN8516_c2_g1_i1.p1 TRINITY_DN8516_c2_g1~~TRINITY_DN8516_c2_g1_i1.p1  ORF type:complete len:184 (+),score=35.38 TRINITY_DN8516_c2_g1_i1:53-553(+)